MAPRKKASVRASPASARATRSSVRQGTASLEAATITAAAQTRRSRGLSSSSAPSVSSDETSLVDALLVEDQQQEQQIGQLEAKVEQLQKEMEKSSAPSLDNTSPAVVVSAPADEQPTDTTTTISPASPASPADKTTNAAAATASAWSYLTTPLRKIFSLSPIAEEAASSESRKRSASEIEDERSSKRSKMSAPEPVPSPAKETPTRRSVKIARQQREARRLAAQYQDSPAQAINAALAPKSRPTLVPSSPRPQKRKSPSPPPKPADTLPSPPKPAVVDVVSKKRKRVKIDDLQSIPSRLPGQSSGTFALLDDFFDLDEDSVEMDEDEVELYMARPTKMARTEHNIFDMSSAQHSSTATTSPSKDVRTGTQSPFKSPLKPVSPTKDAQDAQPFPSITGTPQQDVRTSTQSPLQDVRTSTQPITFAPLDPVSPTKDARDAQSSPPITGTPVTNTYNAEEFDFETPAPMFQDADALTRKRSEAEKYKPAIGSRLREMQRISSNFGSPSQQDISMVTAPSYTTTTPVVQQETYNFPASEPLSADIFDGNYHDLSSPIPERYSFPATQPLMPLSADEVAALSPLSPLPTKWSFPSTQPIFA